MKILALRILPPMAIGRLGESEIPLPAYGLALSDEAPLAFRKIVPETTFIVNPQTGELTSEVPDSIKFKDVDSLENKSGKIRPVAPFLEVFAITDSEKHKGELVPLTLQLLEEANLDIKDISWNVEVGNIKVFRRTGDENDKIKATLSDIATHEALPLLGKCENFFEGKTLPLGTIQYIKPSANFPQIRLRFTPGAGKVYGAHKLRTVMKDGKAVTVIDPVFENRTDDCIIYNFKKGTWRGYRESAEINPLYTNPAQIFAGYDNGDDHISWGYLDDECDGFVTVRLKTPEGKLTAKAHISAGPPAFAPDTLPIRVVSDELEQILAGTDIDGEVSLEEAEDIIRRAFETIRLMNTAVMNGNSYEGKQNVASTMVRQNTNDFGRLYEPIMATSLVDNLALQVLHERVLTGLSTGAAPWFADLLRRPTEIGDLSTKALRKMPALMRGADGRSLTFTYRQINMIVKAAMGAVLHQTPPSETEGTKLKASNLTAQLHYKGVGNPEAILPRTAISNCFPGLEFDFRNLWRRVFDGIVLIENNNYVIETNEKYKDLLHCRLVAIQRMPTMVKTSGPVFPEGDNIDLKTEQNPNGVSFMEWSNSMVRVLREQGKEVVCHFTASPSKDEVLVNLDKLDDPTLYRAVTLKVNNLFEDDSAAISENVLKPGELTQGLCAPWQNDYRECACYYWAASRPDYVNVVPDENGLSTGDIWLSKKRTGKYIPDDRKDSRLVSYDDLFINWQGELNFIIGGNDAIESPKDTPKADSKSTKKTKSKGKK